MNGQQAQHIEKTAGADEVMEVGFKRLSENAVLPTKANPQDAGLDLYAAADVTILPGQTVVIPTDLAIDLPPGYMAQVLPRSGLSSHTQFRVITGTVDAGFIGNIGIIAENSSTPNTEFHLVDRGLIGNSADIASVTYHIRKHDKIAQLVVQPIPQTVAVEITELGESARGESGFGSSGV